MKTKVRDTYEAHIFLGSLYETNKVPFIHTAVTKFVAEIQDTFRLLIPIRVSKVEYICGSKYSECGYQLSVIDYPKINCTVADIEEFMDFLATSILKNFKQKRVSLVTPTITTMYESEEEYAEYPNENKRS